MKTKTIQHAEYEEIVPQAALNQAVVRVGAGDDWDMSALARAEAALAASSGEFAEWMREEVIRLGVAFRSFATDVADTGRRDELYRAAHDIRGQASTLGFPVAGRFADSLCDFMEKTASFGENALALAEAHVDAIRAVVRDSISSHDDATATMLLAALASARTALLAETGTDRPA